MKIKLYEQYHRNGKLYYRFHLTTNGKRHGLYEWYNLDGSIGYLCYWNNGKLIKLDNDYPCSDNIYITYHI